MLCEADVMFFADFKISLTLHHLKLLPKIISSPHNSLIKNIVLLTEKSKERKAQKLLIAEGLREVRLGLEMGLQCKHLLYSPAVFPTVEFEGWLGAAEVDEIIELSEPVMEKIAYRANVPNVVAVFEATYHRLEDMKLSNAPLILVLESVEKPGNLGAMLRTADAAGVDAVIVCDPQTDIYNPNAIRASLGAIFTVPTVSCTTEEAIYFFKQNDIRIVVTWLEASRPHSEVEMIGATAIVMGTEATGITRQWVEAADERAIIPMFGKVDSMNVANSAAIMLFESLRQRSEASK